MKNYILKNENAIYYECGYSCDNVIFLQLGSESFFLTDARYTIEAQNEVNNALVIETSDLVAKAVEVIKKSSIKKLCFDPNDFSYSSFMKMKDSLKIEFKEKPSFSQKKRIIKTQEELEFLKKAAKLGRAGFKSLASYISKEGNNKKETFLNFKAIELMSQRGNLELSFDPIVAINKNAAKPHALPTNKKIKKGDLLLVDAGVKYKRYCSDRTCTASVNFETFNFKREQKFQKKKYQKIYDIVLKAQLNAIEKTRTGMKAKEIDNLTRSVINKAGYGKYFIHSTGHGVGIDIHEHPFINSKNDLILEDGMVFTIEPGIYLPNEFGVRIEDTVMLKDGKAVIL